MISKAHDRRRRTPPGAGRGRITRRHPHQAHWQRLGDPAATGKCLDVDSHVDDGAPIRVHHLSFPMMC